MPGRAVPPGEHPQHDPGGRALTIQEKLERILQLSKADGCIAIGYQTSNANIRFANNTTTTNGVGEESELVVISIVGKRVGVINRNYVPEDKLEDLVRESEAACEGKPEAHDYMPLLDGEGAPPDWNDPFEPTTIGVFDSFAPGLADLFDRARSGGVKLFGYAEHEASTIYLATSTGLRARHRQPSGSIEFTAKSDDFARSAWLGRTTKTFLDLDLDALYRRLDQRLHWSKNQISLPAGRYQALLEPSAVADMLIFKYVMSTRRDADEGRTVFSKPGGGNRVGESLYPETVTIYSDPSEPDLEVTPFNLAVGSSSYASVFDNGLPVSRTEWVSDGVLRALITPRYWAQKSGGEAVPFVGNLIFPSDGPDLEDMIGRTERALLVTCFWYIRPVDPQTLLLTGLTRDGVFLVEDGEVRGAVNNFRYNMSPVDMLKQAEEIGRSGPTVAREFGFGLTKMPPLRVRDFNMSSVSDAT